MALTLMCGLSFSGKSTLAALLVAELDARLLSLDAINAERGLDGGQGIPIEEWAATNRLAHERAAAHLARGEQVVVDDTGSPRFIRDGWRAVADAAGCGFALVWVQIDEELQRRRLTANRAEGGRHDVTDDVLDDHIRDFEAPNDENAIIVAASDTRNVDRIREVVDQIHAREH